jgi:hypothetical protein
MPKSFNFQNAKKGAASKGGKGAPAKGGKGMAPPFTKGGKKPC